ncbi:MAG: LexA family transcriptional regulator [Firmicutes bacterium]|nr:LexA family transcriptional regulator [Bacillota bacterium]
MRVMSEEKLQKLAEFIKQYARDNNGASPGLSDIMDYMGMVKSTAYRHILELERRGVVSYSGKKTLESEQQRKMKCGFRRIPFVGMIVCGTPDEQEEHIKGYLAIPEEWIDGECFILEAYGDSMADIGIEEGDLILVKKTETADSGDVVAALTENGNTLKRLFWENGRPRLHAENKSYDEKKADIYPNELTIQGIALKIIKDIR